MSTLSAMYVWSVVSAGMSKLSVTSAISLVSAVSVIYLLSADKKSELSALK